MSPSNSHETLRFRDFELDVAAYELRHRGRSIRLERRPMDLLILLVAHRRQLVTRREIVERLWGKDVFVDVETAINTAIRKVRQALHDSPDAPAFVETVPGRGYRFVAEVEVVSEPLGGVSGITLAVLPFENLSGESGREYLADGLTDETIASLGQIDPDRLSVVARTSTMAYKRTTKSIADIGRELGADYLVESSIRAEKGRLRVISNLIRVRDQVHVWSESYDREPTSMLGLQQELSSAIAERIRLRLSPDRLKALARRQTQNADAYDLYLRGLNFANQRTPATTRRAIEYYARATALDPDYALAWSGLAFAFAASPMNGDAAPLEVGPHAREAAAQAVRADPNLAEAHHSLGYVKWLLDWDWPAAVASLRRAVRLDPRVALAHMHLGHVLSQIGRHSEASQSMRRARELDPLYAMMHALSSQVAFQARDLSAALEHAQQAIILDPEFWIGHMMRGQAYEQLADDDNALQALTIAGRFSDHNSKAISLRGYLLAKIGRTNEACEVLRTLEAVSRTKYIPPYAMALINAGLRQRNVALGWLDKAYVAGDVHLIFLSVDPKWDPYRADPRFQALLARCGFTRTVKARSAKE